jgi:hypothetical protein
VRSISPVLTRSRARIVPQGHGDNKDKFSPEPVAFFCAVPPPPNPSIPLFAQRAQPKIRALKIACGSSCTLVTSNPPTSSLYFWGITKKAGEAQLKPIQFDEIQGPRAFVRACATHPAAAPQDTS